jgi:hypothetical protein
MRLVLRLLHRVAVGKWRDLTDRIDTDWIISKKVVLCNIFVTFESRRRFSNFDYEMHQ